MSAGVHAKMAALMRDHPILESKSCLIEKTVEDFVERVTLRGLDLELDAKAGESPKAEQHAHEASRIPCRHGDLLVHDEELVQRFACEVLTT